jgi:hypothetical protein
MGYEQEIEEIRELLKEFFRGPENHWKVDAWLTTHNPNFGCIPMTLIQMGRAHKVRNFIKNAKDENGW